MQSNSILAQNFGLVQGLDKDHKNLFRRSFGSRQGTCLRPSEVVFKTDKFDFSVEFWISTRLRQRPAGSVLVYVEDWAAAV